MTKRINRIQEKLIKENLDAFLVTTLTNIRYLCGYSGSNGLLVIFPKKAFFLTDFRYHNQAEKEVFSAQLIKAERELYSDLIKVSGLARKNLKLGFESKNLIQHNFERIKTILPQTLLVSTFDLVENISVIKDKEEIAKVKKATAITDKIFEKILPQLKPGVRECEIAAEIDYLNKIFGADGSSFEAIVASGYRGALPHGRASTKKMQKGELVTLDFGSLYQGYVSDLTRTVVIGKASPRQKKIYEIVLKAQKATIAKARANIKGKELDKIPRDIISKAGFGNYFGHATGHGIGLLVHDKPTVNSKSEDILKPGMIFTIEPGIYLPGWGGVRIEDDILMTSNGCEVLTKAEKNLIEL
jgi:Xaa-Pro aminopeptidase